MLFEWTRDFYVRPGSVKVRHFSTWSPRSSARDGRILHSRFLQNSKFRLTPFLFFHGQRAVVAQSYCTFHMLTVYFNLISGVSCASTFLFNDFTFYLLHIPNPFLSLKFVLAPPHSGLCTYNYHPAMLCCIRAALSAVVFMRRLAVSLLSGLVGMRISVPCWSPIHLQRIQSG